jgi:hypothetical protein
MISRARELEIGVALNKAIWLRDKVEDLTKEEIIYHIKDIGTHEVFSSRQLSAIVNGQLHHSTISKLIGKKDRTGGNLNVGTLDILRHILFTRADSGTDFNLIANALSMGTSQGMVARLTGISQSSISKRLREEK